MEKKPREETSAPASAKAKAATAAGASAPEHHNPSASAPERRDPCIRAENEDDDGYDPYSDRRETTPLFERDPWA